IAQNRSDVIILTGGLGPTEDDLSREAFHEISTIPIVEEPIAMRKIEQFFKEQGSEIHQIIENKQECLKLLKFYITNMVWHQEILWNTKKKVGFFCLGCRVK